MKKQTQTMLLLAGAAFAGYWFFLRGRTPGTQQAALPPAGNGSAQAQAEAAARIAEAQAAAAIAQAEAQAAAAEAAAGEWYTPLLEGVGAGTGQFLGGLGGIFT